MPDKSTVAAGAPEAVRAALDRRRRQERPDALRSLIEDARARFDLWLLTTGSPARSLAHRIGNRTLAAAMKGELFQPIRHSVAGLRYGEPAQIAAEALLETEADATRLAETLQFLAAMHSPPESAGAVPAIKVSAEGKTVRLTMSLSGRQLERLLSELGRAP